MFFSMTLLTIIILVVAAFGFYLLNLQEKRKHDKKQ